MFADKNIVIFDFVEKSYNLLTDSKEIWGKKKKNRDIYHESPYSLENITGGPYHPALICRINNNEYSCNC